MKKSTLSVSLAAQILSALLLLPASPIYANESTPQPGYSTSTLQDPIFSVSEVEAETERITAWLRENYRSLNQTQINGIREQLYYLIDSRIKELYLQSSVILPTEPDPILESLFEWAEPLGVYGGNLAYSAVNSPGSADKDSVLELPDTMVLGLENDLLFVRSASNDWQFEVPYYFMITALSDIESFNGVPVQAAFLSTGATEDSTELGYSQATLAFMFSPNVDAATLENQLREAFEISDRAREIALEGLDQNSYYELDSQPNLELHKEITSWETDAGAFSVIYLGADGTYQWNRAHFLNFVTSIQGS